MFRAILLSIVVTLAAGQNVALLCGAWCHSGGRMVGACEHDTQATTRRIVASDACVVKDSVPVVFVRDDVRRSAPAPNVAGTVTAASFAFTAPAADRHSTPEPNGRLLLEVRPLVLALRI